MLTTIDIREHLSRDKYGRLIRSEDLPFVTRCIVLSGRPGQLGGSSSRDMVCLCMMTGRIYVLSFPSEKITYVYTDESDRTKWYVCNMKELSSS